MHRILLIGLLAVGCASSTATAPPPERSTTNVATRTEGPRPSPAAADCARLCQSYVHFKRGALLECSEVGGCGSRPTHAESADYGRELRDRVHAQCGSACPEAANDYKNASSH